MIVTATLAESGVGWGAELPAGWVEVDAVTATLDVTFDDVGAPRLFLWYPRGGAGDVHGWGRRAADGDVADDRWVTYSMDPADPW